MPFNVTIRIKGDDYALRHSWPRHADATIASDKRGGYLAAILCAVHTHQCVERRWGRKNRDKPCSCGADELFDLATAQPSGEAKEKP